MKFQKSSRQRQLTRDQVSVLIQIIREDAGDNVSRPEFNDSILLIFENIAGLESLTARDSTRLLSRLWQEYRAACQSRP
jgi:hypothetical protein